MKWSYSKYREFKRCQRKWFYGYKLSSSRVKDEIRNEAFILSNFESISAWRGKIVDNTISNYVVRNINNGWNYTLSEAIDYARKLTRERYDFAKAKKYREPDIVKSKHQRVYVSNPYFLDRNSISI